MQDCKQKRREPMWIQANRQEHINTYTTNQLTIEYLWNEEAVAIALSLPQLFSGRLVK